MVKISLTKFSIGFALFVLATIVPKLTVVSWALTPEQVVVVANSKALHSVDLAKYYMKGRNIPLNNLFEINAPVTEHCSREDYEESIASPIKEFLKKNDPEGDRFQCLVTMFGIPLRVRSPKLTPDDREELAKLQKQRDSISDEIKKAEQQQNGEALKGLRQDRDRIKRKFDQVAKAFHGAAVDSELALVREDNYSLDHWLPNKYFLGHRGKEIKNMPQRAMLVSRLDGPSEEIVRRVIDDSHQTEKEGLRGKAYFDARWPDPGNKKVSGGAFYDRAIHNAARLVEKSKRMEVVIDAKEKLFQPGECPDAALYCGWYSLARYVDAFRWGRGAVGFHIASQECQTLKNKGSQVWCKIMLEKGVAATFGPVAEPYVETFPLPDIFFGLLLDGRLSLAECYALANPFWSWQMVLIGDPLYRPFKNNRKMN
jgi:uncharacterized protein (TIGR03790 family)